MKNIQNYRSGNHMKIIAWQMADKLDILVQDIIKKLPHNRFKMINQLDSASDSIGSNIVEGYYSGSTAEFIRFLKYSRRSCAEVQERLMRIKRKDLIDSNLLDSVTSQAIKTGYIIDRLIQSLIKKQNQSVL